MIMGDKELTWQGRELISYTDEGIFVSYGYNSDGIRTYKEVNRVGEIERHEYILNGSQIIKETVFLNGVEQYILVYVYDETGAPIGLKYRTPVYAEGEYDCFFFEKNLQGDVVAIYNESGKKIGTYTYDAWGATTYTTLSRVGVELYITSTYNPFRYRGYYYDTDSGWYYLQSRYYNPTWGRFINEDSCLYSSLLGFNMFLYCENNPVNYIDPYGESATAILQWWNFFAGPVAAAEPTMFGEIVYIGGYIIIGTIALVEAVIIVEDITDIVKEENESTSQNKEKTSGKSKKSNKDKRLKGKPGSINREGYKETKIGKDGRANVERHHTDHGSPKHHSNPHDHDVSWTSDGKPVFGAPRNYWDESIPIFK